MSNCGLSFLCIQGEETCSKGICRVHRNRIGLITADCATNAAAGSDGEETNEPNGGCSCTSLTNCRDALFGVCGRGVSRGRFSQRCFNNQFCPRINATIGARVATGSKSHVVLGYSFEDGPRPPFLPAAKHAGQWNINMSGRRRSWRFWPFWETFTNCDACVISKVCV